ncbi:F5/8 type C domain-containing protein [Amycolatopsis arida]|uniref:F5/8 type C domain-containing protein n=1 Tax=Amycolatopsis arida TaxID=587909 RepID=A0A1I5M1B1_9PSEU|nr:ThuA domain-containing protein [Amycolatopsis arida]TDX93928.1 F5/8 type C domain-containing protein [Amycolatopsis arida]SFP03335.1 F5/8 type C domain-containing protein [Amycolatopsis arida]
MGRRGLPSSHRDRRAGPAPLRRGGFARRVMVLLTGAALALGLSAAPAAGAPPAESTEASESAQTAASGINVLVFSGAPDAQDDPVTRAAEAIEELGERNGLTVDTTTDPAVFSPANLARYRGVVFLSAEGAELTMAQEAAFQDYIAAGGGFLGIRDAARAQARSEWFTGLVGTRPAGNRPTPEEAAAVGASGENPPNETKEKLVDGDVGTKWLTFAPTGWVTVELAEPTVVNRYALSSANDAPGRDPKDWTLRGSADGQSWTDLDRRTGETFPDRFQTKEYAFDNTQPYKFYRLDVTANAGDPLTQLAELELYGADATPPPTTEPTPREAVVSVTDRRHPATRDLPLTWPRTDIWTNWDPNPVGEVHTVAQVQEHTYDPGPAANGPFHPISWCRDYAGGRSFYTGMGGTPESYDEELFRGHLLGALRWTTGAVRGDCQATIAANYKTERLTGKNQQGQLDQHGEMHGLTVAPDGTVFFVGKAACPSGPIPSWTHPDIGLGCGTIHQWKPDTRQVKLLTTLEVFGNRGAGDELVKSEEGLLGITVDPEFAENGWLYVYWMPHDSIDRDKRIGQRTVSRFTYDHATETIDLGSRKDLLSWDAQIHSCCHAGGGLDFDAEGNLYIAVGDSNSSQGSSGYSGNNWTKDYKGLSFQDARRTSGNTNDLNGKILRIRPRPDGTYTIPEGNLFPEADDPGDRTRPEIYVMGVRNPTRLHVDPVKGWLTTGWVGPDAGAPSPELGPAKYETATVITSAGNQGWPYCMGNRQPYRDRSNTDAEVLTGWYDCDDLKNTSPRNTGLVDIPPARDNMIWYAPQGGGPVFPERPDGSGVPTYVEEDATYTQPYFRGGCQAIMPGPTYYRSEAAADSAVAWPEYWDGKWFVGDECTPNNRVAVTVNPDTVAEQGPPAFGEDLRKIIRPGGGSEQLQSWMGAQFGPDGALYMIDYGSGFFSLSDNQKLIRITYEGGPATPSPTVGATAVHNKPLTMAFDARRSGGVSYRWDFGDGATSTEATPRHTYAAVGTYTVTLTVTYADGEVSTTSTEVTVECAVPDDRSTVWLRDSDTGVTNHGAGGGCTINDLIDDESTWPNHGAFVSHVNGVLERLEKDGVITGKEHGALSRAAARSDIGKKGDTGYEAIFDGTAQSLLGWEQAPSGRFEIQPDGSLRSSGGLGMLWYAGKEFGDFSLKLRFRDVAPGEHRANSGVFVRFPDPRTPLEQRPPGSCGTQGAARTSQAWVAIYCGQEVQIYDGASGEPQKTGSIYNFDPVGLDQAGATPKGQWNDYEIRVVGQHYTILRNGVVINEFDNLPGKQSSRAGDPPTDLRQFASGFIGLQNHGNNDLIEFRNIRVRQL